MERIERGEEVSSSELIEEIGVARQRIFVLDGVVVQLSVIGAEAKLTTLLWGKKRIGAP